MEKVTLRQIANASRHHGGNGAKILDNGDATLVGADDKPDGWNTIRRLGPDAYSREDLRAALGY